MSPIQMGRGVGDNAPSQRDSGAGVSRLPPHPPPRLIQQDYNRISTRWGGGGWPLGDIGSFDWQAKVPGARCVAGAFTGTGLPSSASSSLVCPLTISYHTIGPLYKGTKPIQPQTTG
jgi:hypothetical protein